MIIDSRLSREMNAEIEKMRVEFGTEEDMLRILEKYNQYKEGSLALWSITDEEKPLMIKLLTIETELTEKERARFSEENRQIEEQINDIVSRAENGNEWDGVDRLDNSVLNEKKGKGLLSKIFRK